MAGLPGTRLAPDLADGPRAALVIATTSYQDPALRQLRAPAYDTEDLTEVLGDPRIGGFTVTRVIDQDEWQVRRAIDAFLSGRGTDELVLVYLSCHGVLDRRGRLYFAASDTLKTQLGSTGILSVWLLDQLDECRARRQVLILDCCFSGAFAHGSKGDADLDLERRLAGQGRGRAVLTASRAGEYSFEGQALPGAAVADSVFTAGLVEGLRTGAADAGGDGYISVDEAYDYAYGYVLVSGASQTPQRWLSGGEGAIVLARSVRSDGNGVGEPVQKAPEPARSDPARTARILTDAERAAQSISDESSRVGALINVAEALTATDPDRAVRLLAGAEHAAQSITKRSPKAEALTAVAEALAAIDPDRAERIARSIILKKWQVPALAAVAKALAPTDPDRASQLLADAQRTTWSIYATREPRLSVLAALAAIDPDRAEHAAAKSFTDDEDGNVLALVRVAEALAATDPGRSARVVTRAERIAASIVDRGQRAAALSYVAEAVAVTDPDRAEHIAGSITDKDWREVALVHVAGTLAVTDPDRAERIAGSITDKDWRASALTRVAEALAATDRERAARLIADVEHVAHSILDEDSNGLALAEAANALAATDPDRAERIAASITDDKWRATALADVAQALAPTDPDRAEHIAQSITDAGKKVSALVRIAEA
jgi:hypothetical protein